MKDKHMEFIQSIISLAADIQRAIDSDSPKLDGQTLADLRHIDGEMDDLACYLAD